MTHMYMASVVLIPPSSICGSWSNRPHGINGPWSVRRLHCAIVSSLFYFLPVSSRPIHAGRGVQYVHWVMHICIMVKVGGKRNSRKVCKKQVNLCKTGGEICQSRGEIIIFAKQGEMY